MRETSESAYSSFENSKSDLISNNSMSRNNNIKTYDLSVDDYNPEGARKSSFHLRSPKKTLHQVIQPSFTIDDLKIDTGELSSCDFSFTLPKIRTENYPAMSTTAPKAPDSLKNDYLSSHNDQMFCLSETRRNEIFSWILSSNRSNRDDISSMKCSDDGENSIDFSSLKYEAQTVADILFENYCGSDDDLQTDNSTLLPMPTPGAAKSHCQTFIDSSFDSVDNQLDSDLDGNLCSRSRADNERSLPYGKRERQIQWHTCPDSLESALTTEAEKLNEIKNYL
ncbi:uncharacterized protein LOC135842085 isoform X3 [Planococcus citri]